MRNAYWLRHNHFVHVPHGGALYSDNRLPTYILVLWLDLYWLKTTAWLNKPNCRIALPHEGSSMFSAKCECNKRLVANILYELFDERKSAMKLSTVLKISENWFQIFFSYFSSLYSCWIFSKLRNLYLMHFNFWISRNQNKI